MQATESTEQKFSFALRHFLGVFIFKPQSEYRFHATVVRLLKDGGNSIPKKAYLTESPFGAKIGHFSLQWFRVLLPQPLVWSKLIPCTEGRMNRKGMTWPWIPGTCILCTGKKGG